MIDPVGIFIHLDDTDADATGVPGVDDTFEKFLHRRQLAALGINAEGLEKEASASAAQFAKRFDDRFFKQATPYENTPADPAEVLPVDDDDRLAKAGTAARKKNSLQEWIEKSLANGETVESLVAYAEGNGFHAQADEIRKAAAGL